MSGLVGSFQHNRIVAPDEIPSMLSQMPARCDGTGIWQWRAESGDVAFGACPKLAGTRADGPADGVTAAFCGQLTNLRDLIERLAARGELLVPNDSPATVLRIGYAVWGEGIAERLEGEYAFALWDSTCKELLLGRDRMGVKPLYYYLSSQGMLFASTPGPILTHPDCSRRVSLEVLPIILQPRLALRGETPVSGLHELRPGHLLRASSSGVREKQYWGLPNEYHDDTFDKSVCRVRELLENAVRDRCVGANSAMLSGGLDSTAVASLAQAERRAKGLEPLSTFCISFDSDRTHFVQSELRPDLDAPFAVKAAKNLGTIHIPLTITSNELRDALPEIRRARALPAWGQFDASMFVLFRAMGKLSRVGLTGEIADELFGGYPYLFDEALINRNTFPWLGDGEKLSDFLSPDAMERARPGRAERERYDEIISRTPRISNEDKKESRIREILFLGMAGPLSVVIDRKERMSSAAGLDVRMPYCDHKLVEYVWSTPWAFKSKGGVKGLLKAAVSDIVPRIALERKKSAYPHIQCPEYDAQLIADARDIVNDTTSAVGQLFDRSRFSDFLKRVQSDQVGTKLPGGASAAGLLTQVVEFDQWLRDYTIVLD